MYVLTMNITTRYQQGQYCFASKKECKEFIDGLTDIEADAITSVEKFNKKSIRSAYHEFFWVPKYI